jgi:hypothetical protein
MRHIGGASKGVSLTRYFQKRDWSFGSDPYSPAFQVSIKNEISNNKDLSFWKCLDEPQKFLRERRH